MKNSTLLGYRGEVTVRYNKNGRTFEFKKHNEGFEPLFHTICHLLAGDGFPYGNLAYIELKRVKSSDNTEEDLLNSQYLPLSQLPKAIKQSNGEWACSVNTTIADSDIQSGERFPSGYDDTARVYLVSNDKVEMAKVELSKNIIESIAPGVQLFIQWNLVIDNKPDETSESET